MKILDDLEAAEALASPAPWKEDTGTFEDRLGAYACGPYHDSDKYEYEEIDDCSDSQWEADAEKDAKLIALSRNNLKALIECARAVSSLLEAEDRVHDCVIRRNFNNVSCDICEEIWTAERGSRDMAREALAKLEGGEK